MPADCINATLHERFLQPAHLNPPSEFVSRGWWAASRKDWLQGLRDKVFHGWPETSGPLNAKLSDELVRDGLRLRVFDFTSQEGVGLRLHLLTAAAVTKPSLVVLTALDEPGWKEWTEDLGPPFQALLQLDQPPKLDAAKFAQNRKALESNKWAFAAVVPRGIGPTRWAADGTPTDIHVRRRFALLGQTLDGQRVWDVRRSLAVLRGVPELKGTPLWLQGKGDMAGIVLYAGLFEPDVARFDLWHPPASHRTGPIFLNVRRLLDMPQAVALAFPRPVRLYVKEDMEAQAWEWPLQLQKALGEEYLKIRPVGN
jgi:hypothetical protein